MEKVVKFIFKHLYVKGCAFKDFNKIENHNMVQRLIPAGTPRTQMSPGNFFPLQKFKFLILAGNSVLYKQRKIEYFQSQVFRRMFF